MKKILVPCDFSKPSVQAFRFALDLASRSNGSIHLIHVIELPVLHDTMLMPTLNFEKELLVELKEKASKEFVKLLEKYKEEGVNVTWNVEFGAPSKTILENISSNGTDLVVMGSHGASGLREYLIGSNAEKIIRKSVVPVLVVKDFYKGAVKNIVFPNILDLDDQDELMIKVKALQTFFEAHLNIVWINTPLNFTSDVFTLERLNDFAKRYKVKNYSLHIFNHPVEEDGILEFTKLVKGDMIAMGTHGRVGLAHLINGSMAEDVANHTSKLMWTYKISSDAVNILA